MRTELPGKCSVVWCGAKLSVVTMEDYMRDATVVAIEHVTPGGKALVKQIVTNSVMELGDHAMRAVVESLVHKLEQMHLTDKKMSPPVTWESLTSGEFKPRTVPPMIPHGYTVDGGEAFTVPTPNSFVNMKPEDLKW